MRTTVCGVCVLGLLLVPGSGLSQTPATGRIMREKLAHTQNVLEAIMTSDLVALERESVALLKATEAPAGTSFEIPSTCSEAPGFSAPLATSSMPRDGATSTRPCRITSR